LWLATNAVAAILIFLALAGFVYVRLWIVLVAAIESQWPHRLTDSGRATDQRRLIVKPS